MSGDLDGAGKRTLEGIAARREGTEARFCSPLEPLSKELPAKTGAAPQGRKTLARSTHCRLLAAGLLPPDARRALYLDADMVCAGSLEELFSLDMKGRPCGMCYALAGTRLSAYNRLGYPPEDGYFNSGVILLDLDLWRREGIAAAMLDYLRDNCKKILWHDNDLLCAVLHGRILPLDFSYNVMSYSLFVYYWIREEENGFLAADTQYLLKADWPALKAACEAPRLVHFLARPKPWYRECDAPPALPQLRVAAPPEPPNPLALRL